MKALIVARLTVRRQNGQRTIVEIPADATYSEFYRYYQQDGLKRSTKRPIRTANRNTGLPVINAHLYEPGIEKILSQLYAYQGTSNPIIGHTLRIIKKRAYRKLITAPANEIGVVKVHAEMILPVPVPLIDRIPSTFIPMKKKWSILTSRRSMQEVSS